MLYTYTYLYYPNFNSDFSTHELGTWKKKLTILLHVLSAFNYILTNEEVYCKG